MNVTNRVLIEVGEGERLQMLKAGAAQVAPHPLLDLGGTEGGGEVDGCLEEEDENVEDHEPEERVRRPLADEVVEGVALEEGDRQIRRAPRKGVFSKIFSDKKGAAKLPRLSDGRDGPG